ncbi:TetR/AcrR family transcriptional regulator [Novosphingobium sp.]|uniref:TetR/AcrR family transcriptional regulator n=1 Tax=Novosphingobium sp. TaxID=1874826 RepID=UPI002613D1D7|nr:TetR/AcrR family transcriptional regulator [Novosphingobium sp.]
MAANAVLSRTQEERTEAAKGRLRDAALALFGEQGYEATALAAISLKAGFSRTLAQYHYPDKADIAVEILEDRLLRDNHLELLACPDDAAPELAWDCLIRHLEAVAAYYGNLHGANEHNVIVRGEMALHAAALMGADAALTAKVHERTVDLIARIERLFEIARKGGLIAADSDPHALAILHVHSIWGLALALFASPKATKSIAAAFQQIRVLVDALRISPKS